MKPAPQVRIIRYSYDATQDFTLPAAVAARLEAAGLLSRSNVYATRLELYSNGKSKGDLMYASQA